jgi:hypothetical protein
MSSRANDGIRLTSDTRVIGTLTNDGTVPLELYFVRGSALMMWDPETGSLVGPRVGSEEHFRECREFVKRRGAYFQEWREVADWAVAHNWPSLDRLLALIEEVKRRTDQA